MNAILATTLLVLAAQKDPASTREAMKPVQLLVGEWRANVTPDDGSEGWEEFQAWEYRIEQEVYALQATFKEGKRFKSAVLSYDLKRKMYRFDGVRADGKPAAFEGLLAGKELTLDEVVAGGADQERLRFNLLRDNRILIAIEKRGAGKKNWAPALSIASTKQGVPFVKADGPKCVVTGGTPQTEVAYKGQSYFVCCNSCRKEFLADPEKSIALAKKEGWIK